jgi:hypothetical protein
VAVAGGPSRCPFACSRLPTLAPRWVVPHAWVAAFEAAAGLLNVAVDSLLDELVLSLPPARKVLSIPPLFSGLGVREDFR